MPEPEQFENLAIGLSVNDGEACVVLTTGTAEHPAMILLSPDVAIHFGQQTTEMGVEARALQDQLSKMTQDELVEYVTSIQRRTASGNN